MCTKKIASIIDAKSKSFPDKIALKNGKAKISYEELTNFSNRISQHIQLSEQNTKNIVILMDRSIEAVISILGTLKSGKVFVPVDPTYPKNRIFYMIQEVESNVILTTSKYVTFVKDLTKNLDYKPKIVAIDVVRDLNKTTYLEIDNEKQVTDTCEVCSIFQEDCYIYFTSGSTGRPKGILGKESSLLHYLEWEIKTFNVDENCISSQLISPSFDPYLRDTFIPLLVGGTLVIPDNYETIVDNKKLLKWLNEQNINFIHMGKTLFNQLLVEVNKVEDLAYVKHILLSGESLKGIDIQKIKQIFGERITLVNLYGPTETTLAATYHITTMEDMDKVNVPVGKGISDVDIYIFNEDKTLCKQDEIGEIYIATNYATKGYYKNEALTLEKFTTYEGKTLYATGDIGYRDANHEIVCLGRKDRQIKINGLRIELGEIESVLASSFKANQFVVVACGEEDKKYLVTYYVGEVLENHQVFTDTLALELPKYMIPARYVHLDTLPLLPNGKVDVKGLIALEAKSFTAGALSDDEVENTIAEIVEATIGTKLKSIEENILYLGASSLDATTIIGKIYERYEILLTLSDVLKCMTIKHIAECVKAASTSAIKPVHTALSEYEMTEIQKGMFILNKVRPEGIDYNVTEAIYIQGKVNANILEEAYRHIMARHEILRTTFMINELGSFMQQVHPEGILEVEYIDYTARCKNDIFDAKALKQVTEKFVKAFHLEKLPLFRVLLIKVTEEAYILMQDSHHIIVDGASAELIFREVLNYLSDKSLEPSQYTYIDYSKWQQDRWKKGELEAAKAYWYEKFKDGQELLDLPLDYPRTVHKTDEGDGIQIEIDDALTRKIRLALKDEHKTLSSYLLTAFVLLLNRYAGQDQFTIGIPMTIRQHPNFEDVVGMFVNTLPFKVNINKEDSIALVMEQVFEDMMQMIKYQAYPFNSLVEDLKIKPDRSRNPLFDVIFNFIDTEGYHIENDQFKSTRINLPQITSKFDLSLIVYEEGERISLCFQYSTQLFKPSTIERMAYHYINLLQEIASKKHLKIKEINILDKEEKTKLQAAWPMDKLLTEKTFVTMFLEQVKKHPDKVAIVADEAITYSKLDEMSNFIAHQIKLVSHEDAKIVGIDVKRNPWLIASMIGALRAGFAYLPIDPEYPESRIDYMLEDSGCKLIITDEDVKLSGDYKLLNIHNLIYSHFEESMNLCNGDELAYLIYTSGSTGKPKGVMLTNNNLSSFCKSIQQEIPFGEDKSILCVTTVCFDIFVLETLVPLSTGGKVILANENQQKSPYELSELIIQNKVNMLQFTPSRLKLFIDVLQEMACLNDVEHLIVGGEAFDESILDHVKPTEKLHLYNIYGPTEATVWCAIKEIKMDEKLTIGKPFTNTRLYVFDELERLQPVGVLGELYIGGVCVGEGYINRQDLTDERFKPNPYVKGEKIYKTGDRVRLLDNGEYEFFGRTDFQVKLRGFRVELSEIEKTLLQHEQIKDCVCNLYKENSINILAAYYIGDEDLDAGELKELLGKTLPHYMIPEAFVRIEKMPFTLNGKVDRKALPKPTRSESARSENFKAATNEVERKLQLIWQEVLGNDSIGIEDNFFDIGGNSVLLVRMHYRVMQEWDKQISVSDMFSYPTIAKLGAYLQEEEAEQYILKTNTFPEAFFEISSTDQQYGCTYELEEDTEEALKQLSKKYEVSLENLMCALYTYTLSATTDRTQISLYLGQDEDKFKEIIIDFSHYEDFIEVARDMDENESFVTVDSKTIGNHLLVKDNHMAACLYAFNSTLHEEVLMPFDLRLMISQEEKMNLACYYNANYINANKAEELMTLFINILEAFIQREQ